MAPEDLAAKWHWQTLAARTTRSASTQTACHPPETMAPSPWFPIAQVRLLPHRAGALFGDVCFLFLGDTEEGHQVGDLFGGERVEQTVWHDAAV